MDHPTKKKLHKIQPDEQTQHSPKIKLRNSVVHSPSPLPICKKQPATRRTRAHIGGVLTWQKVQHAPRTPAKRHGHTAVAYNTKLFVFGGNIDKMDDQLWMLDTVTHKWVRINIRNGSTPSLVSGHSAVVVNRSMFVFGGKTKHECTNELWELDLGLWEWRRRSVENGQSLVPPARYGHACVAVSTHLWIFGGSDKVGTTFFNDLWRYDLDTNIWVLLHPKNLSPPPRMGHSFLVYEKELVLFGGAGPTCHYNDVWTFNLETQVWQIRKIKGASQPYCRCYHTAIKVTEHKLIVFGGLGRSAYSDLWQLDMTPTQWKWNKLDVLGSVLMESSYNRLTESFGPLSRYLHTATVVQHVKEYCRMYIIGGLDENNRVHEDLWYLSIDIDGDPIQTATTWQESLNKESHTKASVGILSDANQKILALEGTLTDMCIQQDFLLNELAQVKMQHCKGTAQIRYLKNVVDKLETENKDLTSIVQDLHTKFTRLESMLTKSSSLHPV